MSQIVFVGLVNFFELMPRGRILLVPDGCEPPSDLGAIAPHFAAFFLHCEDILDASNWWPSCETTAVAARHVRELRVETPSIVTISGLYEENGTEPFDDNDFEKKLIRLRDINSGIAIKPGEAVTIAEIPVRHGKLTSRLIAGSLCADLRIEGYTGPITIKASPKDWSPAKTIVLRPGAEIVFGNISQIEPEITSPAESHFRLYAQLDSKRDADRLPSPTKEEIEALELMPVRESHRFVQYLSQFGTVPDGQCSITGCCRCLGRSDH